MNIDNKIAHALGIGREIDGATVPVDQVEFRKHEYVLEKVYPFLQGTVCYFKYRGITC